jgi:hypothetical protein
MGATPSRAAKSPRRPSLERIREAIASGVKKYRYSRAVHREFQRCGAEQVSQMARDMGITTGELYNFAFSGPAGADELGGVSRAVGVDLNALATDDPVTLRDLQRSCIVCRHKNQCRKVLFIGDVAEKVLHYCPNAAVFQSLAELGPGIEKLPIPLRAMTRRPLLGDPRWPAS